MFADEDDSLIFTKALHIDNLILLYNTSIVLNETYFATFLSVIFGVMLASKAEGYIDNEKILLGVVNHVLIIWLDPK